jgi:hypothetical protein
VWLYISVYVFMYVCLYACVCVCVCVKCQIFVVKIFYEACLIISLDNVAILNMTEKYLKQVWWTYNEFIFNKRGDVHTNVTQQHFHVAIIFQWKVISITFYKCVSAALFYPACNMHAPYCNLWHIQCYGFFPHYFLKAWFLEKNVVEHKMCLWLSHLTNFFWNISHSNKKWARCYLKCK